MVPAAGIWTDSRGQLAGHTYNTTCSPSQMQPALPLLYQYHEAF